MADVDDFFTDSHGKGHPGRRELAALAGRQHGVIARRQLAELGFGGGAIDYQLSVGRLHQLHRGVYAVGHRALPSNGHWMAAVLACGPDAVLSHRSAGASWQLRPTSTAIVDVTVPARGRSRRRGIALHQVRNLPAADRTRRDRIPVTTIPRTLLDLAEVLRPRQLERAFEEAERLRLLDVRAVEELCRRSPGRRGLAPLGALLAEQRAPAPETRSELERRFLDLCRDTGLPRPSVNIMVAGFEVDAVWIDRRLVVELDGHAFHRTRGAFERDRVRDATLQLAGYRVIRVTDRRLRRAPAEVARAVRSLLAADTLRR